MFFCRRKSSHSLLTFWLLPALLLAQGVWRAEAAAALQQQQPEQPYAMVGVIYTLTQKHPTKEELIKELAQKGVEFQLTDEDEKEIRRAGAYLKGDLEEVITAVRLNYINAPVNETVPLPLGKTARVRGMGFTFTYTTKRLGVYFIRVTYPGADELMLQTPAHCEYPLKRGPREFLFGITEASSQMLTATLVGVNKVTPPSRKDPKAWADYVGNLPAEMTIRLDPCVPIRMRLVRGGGPDVGGPAAAYYISDPLTIGTLRYYLSLLPPPVSTQIPPEARDTDPITEIHHADALGIAAKLHASLPSPGYLLNAMRAGVLTPTGQAELAADPQPQGDFLVLQPQKGAGSPQKIPGVTTLAPKGSSDKSQGPVRGLIRVIRVVDPGERTKSVTLPPP
jgi:hypothetical protein